MACFAVGGSFDQVNGEYYNGFVLLDPKTGQVAKDWDIRVVSRYCFCSGSD